MFLIQSRQVAPGLGHQRYQSGNEVQRLDEIAGSDFEQPKAGPMSAGQDARSKITCVWCHRGTGS